MQESKMQESETHHWPELLFTGAIAALLVAGAYHQLSSDSRRAVVTVERPAAAAPASDAGPSTDDGPSNEISDFQQLD